MQQQPPLPAALASKSMGMAGFSQQHQRVLLMLMLTRPRFALTNVGVVIPGHFDLEIHRYFCQWVFDFVQSRTDQLPSKEYLQFKLYEEWGQRDQNKYQAWWIELDACYAVDQTGATDVLDKYLSWCREERLKAILYKSLRDFEAGRELDVGGICKELRQADDYVYQQKDIGIKLFGDAEVTLDLMSDKYDRRVLPTGDSQFDKNLSGGPGIGEMLLYVAPPKTGKTTRMLHDVRLYSRSGLPGVFITGEQARVNLCRRLAEAVTEAPAYKFKDTVEGQLAWQQWAPYLQQNYAPVYVDHMTRFGPDDVGRYIEKCNADHGSPMRFAVVDYLNLMTAKKTGEVRHEIAALGRDLRAVFTDLDVVGLTATQANRSAASDELVYKETISECYELIGIADVIIGIAQPEELSKQGIMNLFGAASRIGAGYWKLQYRTELAFARLYEIEVGEPITAQAMFGTQPTDRPFA